MVEDFKINYRPGAFCEMRFYANQKTFTDAIEQAALCKMCNGETHPHQKKPKRPECWIPPEALEEAHQRLLAIEETLQAQSTFEELHTLVRNTIHPIPRIGALAIYDISQRLGAFLGREPAYVYLHAGTVKGANKLKFPVELREGDKLPKEAFVIRDAAFGELTPNEIENSLCLYQNSVDFEALRELTPDEIQRFLCLYHMLLAQVVG
jgi:hypothetical protein